ncbi:large ribosomal RNA subunit accumulation protein YCED homolog 2, chloroplastic isoform X2 [Cucumis sativus]|uniref:large ribosomal RNA subunit accumulation protein YCED homolog 2, chloroplastic isoform X2 n=1 Tax=Cucumis sativus TaxID=3659 RepID=UPI0012F4E3C8|nr:large ribosomal RNA subunit accumulation protein YCED homolog 2, chloroplastic isoform X2 [Cucumis sativus]
MHMSSSISVLRSMQVSGSLWMEGSTHHSLESVVPVLRHTAERANREIHLPDIGGDDPSVIYVKPGLEADLDSLVRDTIRLTTSTKDTCSEMCEKSQPTVQYIGAQNAASIDKRWSRLLELRKSNS